jgi:glutamyl endopeptidase
MNREKISVAILVLFVFLGLQAGFVSADPLHTMVFSDGSRAIAPEADEREALTSDQPWWGSAPKRAELAAQGVSFDRRPDIEAMLEKMRDREIDAVAAPEAVVGVDSRVRNYTTTYPARAVVLIEFDSGGCSGFLVSRDTVATAGHCVHSGGPSGSWYSNFRVYPGYNNGAPYGSCGWTRAGSVSGWTDDGNDEYDYGYIKLDCNVGDTTGYFPLLWKAGYDTLKNFSEAISGYPGDKGLDEQWQSHNKITNCLDRLLYYKNDTAGGMSGSPIWFDKGIRGPHAIGIHTHAYGTAYNYGTRISEPVYNNYQYWISQPK